MEHDGCVGCKYKHEDSDSQYCIGCKQNAIDKYKRMTNADRIRNMSDEELAEFLNDIKDNDFFMWETNRKYNGFIKWLQSESEE